MTVNELWLSMYEFSKIKIAKWHYMWRFYAPNLPKSAEKNRKVR